MSRVCFKYRAKHKNNDVIQFTFKNIICCFCYKSQFALGQNCGLFKEHLILGKNPNSHQKHQFFIETLTAKYIINYFFIVTLLFRKNQNKTLTHLRFWDSCIFNFLVDLKHDQMQLLKFHSVLSSCALSLPRHSSCEELGVPSLSRARVGCCCHSKSCPLSFPNAPWSLSLIVPEAVKLLCSI